MYEKEVVRARDALLSCKNPVFFFHDDPDGFCSFLLLYRFVREGSFFCVKSSPRITKNLFARKVEEFGADAVFVLDVAQVDEEFVEAVNVPIVWIDHHDPQDIDGVEYVNPRKFGENVPTSAMCWDIVQQDRPQDLWLAVAGCVADWYLPRFVETLRSASPDLVPRGAVDELLFDSRLGLLIKVLAFNLKGSSGDVKKSIRSFMKVVSPYEVLNQESDTGRFLWHRFQKINRTYDELLKLAMQNTPEQGVFVFYYTDDHLSVTKELANELLYRKKCVVIVGRERMGELRCSFRSPASVELTDVIPKALKGLTGRAGGHEHAMGGVVAKEDFLEFVDRLKNEVAQAKH